MRLHKLFATAVIFAGALSASAAARAQSAYQVVSVSDGGTISGIVKWSGEKPKPLTLPITKDVNVCDPEKAGTRDLERLEIGPEGGVGNTVVYLRGVTKGKAWDLPDSRRSLDQKSCRYVPHISLVQTGGDFGMKSSDPILHTIHMMGAVDYNLPFPMINVLLTRPMRKGGTVELKCNAGHIWMNGVIFIVNHPYYAITDEHGSFRLTDVPPGEYEIVAWHEGWRVAREEPVLDVGTQTKTKRLFFTEPLTWEKKVTVAPNGRSNVEFTISER
jgi:nitrous oxide reductase accessory protein NosL